MWEVAFLPNILDTQAHELKIYNIFSACSVHDNHIVALSGVHRVLPREMYEDLLQFVLPKIEGGYIFSVRGGGGRGDTSR